MTNTIRERIHEILVAAPEPPDFEPFVLDRILTLINQEKEEERERIIFLVNDLRGKRPSEDYAFALASVLATLRENPPNQVKGTDLKGGEHT